MTERPPTVAVPNLPARARQALVVLSLLALGAFLFVALARIGYPHELEFMTGACLDHVHRVLDGDPLYVEPTADFVTWLYGPLFFYAGAAASWIAGEANLIVLRVVSLSAALITTALVFWTVLKATHNRIAAIASVGLWTSTYGIVGTWWDIGRVDSLFVMWVMVAIALLWRGNGIKTAVLAGIAMTLGYLTKQTTVVLVPAFAIGLAFRSLPRAAWFAGSFAVTLLPTIFWFDATTDGWFSFYTWEVPRAHGSSLAAWWQFFPADTARILPMLLASTWLFGRLLATSRWRKALCYGAFGGGLWLASNLSRAHLGGAENVLIPTHLGFAILAALALAESTADRRWRWPIFVLVVVQFGCSFYRPWHYLPTDRDRAIGDKLVAELRSVDGNVMVPYRGNYGRRVDKPQAAHVLAVLDVQRGPNEELGLKLCQQFLDYSWGNDCDMLVLDGPTQELSRMIVREDGKIEWRAEPLFEVELDEHGKPVVQANGRELFMPVVGLQTRPTVILRRTRD